MFVRSFSFSPLFFCIQSELVICQLKFVALFFRLYFDFISFCLLFHVFIYCQDKSHLWMKHHFSGTIFLSNSGFVNMHRFYLSRLFQSVEDVWTKIHNHQIYHVFFSIHQNRARMKHTQTLEDIATIFVEISRVSQCVSWDLFEIRIKKKNHNAAEGKHA